ncbi:hypothetical protein CLV62_12218 [Dysgonomonas alginatilytica]|uniref:Quinol oxidase subunit 4 n=1 Tax=Dysgonomonas alginatilytica TaxID=1605892 RepID=A0A2V3PLF8_9BACT|nr:hypothetical protein [Dysgonomonas alginatilytica]PXV62065.1 hypothetical protein CLV62_12218 [Dysgonomonas alginatilytica]
MKKIGLILALIFLTLFVFSCRTVNTNKNGIPPGQMKKITGSKSAKEYAPGHNK